MMRNPKMKMQIPWGSHSVCVKNMPYLPNLEVSFPLESLKSFVHDVLQLL